MSCVFLYLELIKLILRGFKTLLIGTWLIIFTNDPAKLGLFAGHPTLQTLAIASFTAGQ